VDRLLGEWCISKDSPAGRQRLEQVLEEGRGAEEGEEFKPIRLGWCLGEEKFREELLTQMSEGMGAETTMTVGWIAERLAMGARGYLNHLLYRRRKLDGDLTISRNEPFTLWLRYLKLLTLTLLSDPFTVLRPRTGVRAELRAPAAPRCVPKARLLSHFRPLWLTTSGSPADSITPSGFLPPGKLSPTSFTLWANAPEGRKAISYQLCEM